MSTSASLNFLFISAGTATLLQFLFSICSENPPHLYAPRLADRFNLRSRQEEHATVTVCPTSGQSSSLSPWGINLRLASLSILGIISSLAKSIWVQNIHEFGLPEKGFAEILVFLVEPMEPVTCSTGSRNRSRRICCAQGEKVELQIEITFFLLKKALAKKKMYRNKLP